MKLVCKPYGFLQTGHSLFGAEINQGQSLQFVHQVSRDMGRLLDKWCLEMHEW